MRTWRDICRPIIAEVIERVGRSDEKALRKALREAYPFGERKYHPYKIWCSEIQVQLGNRTLGARRPSEPAKFVPAEGQTELF